MPDRNPNGEHAVAPGSAMPNFQAGRFKGSLLENLPFEVGREIAKRLDPSSLTNLSAASKPLRPLLDHLSVAQSLKNVSPAKVVQYAQQLDAKTDPSVFQTFLNYAAKETLSPKERLQLLQAVARDGTDAHRDEIFEKHATTKNFPFRKELLEILTCVAAYGNDKHRDKVFEALATQNILTPEECVKLRNRLAQNANDTNRSDTSTMLWEITYIENTDTKKKHMDILLAKKNKAYQRIFYDFENPENSKSTDSTGSRKLIDGEVAIVAEIEQNILKEKSKHTHMNNPDKLLPFAYRLHQADGLCMEAYSDDKGMYERTLFDGITQRKQTRGNDGVLKGSWITKNQEKWDKTIPEYCENLKKRGRPECGA